MGVAQYGHLSSLEEPECERLVRSQTVGRVAWQSRVGLRVLPVAYVMDGPVIVFRTSPVSVLAQLADPQPVTFEVDDIDQDTRTGWSVVVEGTTGSWTGHDEGPQPEPWAPGERPVLIAITPVSYSGRSVASE